MIIWNYFHTACAKQLKTAISGDYRETLLVLIAVEWILPDVAFRMMRLKFQHIEESLLNEDLLPKAIDRLNYQLKIYAETHGNKLPERMSNLNGEHILNMSDNGEIISGDNYTELFEYVKNALRLGGTFTNVGDDHDGEKPGFFHACLRDCMAALHVINTAKLPEYRIENTDNYVSRLWVKQDFSEFHSMLKHFAELEKRKHGFKRINNLCKLRFQAKNIGKLPNGKFYIKFHDKGKEYRNNYYLENVCDVEKYVMKLFDSEEEYLAHRYPEISEDSK